jgi:hypothetical protein
MKMEPIERSETSASNTQTPGNYPKETVLPSMTFAQRRNRLTTHFLERIPVGKRSISVSIGPNYRDVFPMSLFFRDVRLNLWQFLFNNKAQYLATETSRQPHQRKWTLDMINANTDTVSRVIDQIIAASYTEWKGRIWLDDSSVTQQVIYLVWCIGIYDKRHNNNENYRHYK